MARNFLEIWYWGLHGILSRNSRFAESRKEISASSLHEDKVFVLLFVAT